MIETLTHLLAQLYDVRGLIEWGGTLLVCVIVFVETGMFVGFFLPGDSLLVTAGVFAGAGQLKLAELLSLVTLCAIAGDQVGYSDRLESRENLYGREDSRFFKKKHLETRPRVLRDIWREDDHSRAVHADHSHILPARSRAPRK